MLVKEKIGNEIKYINKNKQIENRITRGRVLMTVLIVGLIITTVA